MSRQTKDYAEKVGRATNFLESKMFKDLEASNVPNSTIMAINKLYTTLLICQKRLADTAHDCTDAAEIADNVLTIE